MRSVLITGCSSGIGRHAAGALAARGWHVFASCRRSEDCAALQAAGFASPRLDYTDPASIDAAVAEVLSATGGRLDALINNGAYAQPGPLEDLPTEALRLQFETNLVGWHHLTRAVLPAMRAQGQGRIVMVSSILGFVPARLRGAYVASKFALEGYTECLRMEMAELGLHVSAVEPGPIRTKIRTNAVAAFERWIDWQASPRAPEYRAGLLQRIREGSGDTPFQLGPEAVTAKLIHALEAPRPRRYYPVTWPTWIMAGARRVLPPAVFLALCARA